MFAVQVIGSVPYLWDKTEVRACTSTSSCTSLATCGVGVSGASNFTADATNVYYSGSQGVTASPIPSSCSGLTMKTIAPASGIAAFASDANEVYWITTTGVVRKTTKNAPGP